VSDALVADALDPGLLEIVDMGFFEGGVVEEDLDAIGSGFLEAADAPDVEQVRKAAGSGGVVAGLLVGEERPLPLRCLEAGRPYSGSRRMAEACLVRTSVTRVLNSSRSWASAAAPRSLARDFWSEPRWSMAAAAMTPRWSETAFKPASFPGVNFSIDACLLSAWFFVG
jgi:hypothetical protein